jgi:hypothetical protein
MRYGGKAVSSTYPGQSPSRASHRYVSYIRIQDLKVEIYSMSRHQDCGTVKSVYQTHRDGICIFYVAQQRLRPPRDGSNPIGHQELTI